MLALVALANPPTAVAQGAINFNNKVAGVVDAPILLCQDMRNGAGEFPGLKVQLMLVGPGGTITAVGDLARFRTNPPAATGYFDGGTVIIPGNNGTPVTLRLRYWTGASYESSLVYGQSHDFTVTPTLLPYVPADLTGLGTVPIYASLTWLSGCSHLVYWIAGDHATVRGYWSGYYPVGQDVVIRETYEGRPVVGIGGGAFRQTRLRSIYIPQSITNIGPSPFGGCNELQDIQVDSRNGFYESVEGALFDESRETLMQYPAGRTNNYAIPETTRHVAVGAFSGALVTGVTIPDSVLSVGHGAFELCRNLTNAILGASITNIETYAFSECVGLTSVAIPDSVLNIGSSAFFGSTNLTSAVIGSGVRGLGTYAFQLCSGLKHVLFMGDAPVDLGSQFLGTPATVYYLPGAKGWGATFGGAPTAVWDPRAEELSVGMDGFGFGIRGAAGLPLVIEAAGSLAAPVWVAVGTNVLSDAGLGVFREASALGWPSRFYRFRFQ